MFRIWNTDRELEEYYSRYHPLYAKIRAYYKIHPDFHKTICFIEVMVCLIFNLFLIIKNHVPNFLCVTLLLVIFYDYKLAGTENFLSILSYRKRNGISGVLLITINLVVFWVTAFTVGVPDPFSALYGRIMIEYTDYVSIPYCFDNVIFWSKHEVEKPDDLKPLLKKYTGYDFTSLYKYGYNEKEKEFEIMDYQENLKYTIIVRQVNNHYQYFIDEEN